MTAPDGSSGLPPTYLTRFVGRRAELAELGGLLTGQRLLTIAGSGGCGKTRLAREILVGLGDRWNDGARWVDLGAVTDQSRIAEVAASAVGLLLDPASDPRRALGRRLRDGHLLLCLDNCEHLVGPCAALVVELLSTCPGLTVLATSREPLGVPGETVWRVPSMDEGDAMDLFADRARGVHPAYVADPSTEATVQTLCRRLDGIPLAIELAAAWVGTLTPAQITTALDDRFRLLVGGSRSVVPRQQTLSASVAWSYNLLRDDARTLLRRLAVFSGGFTLATAEAVCTGGELVAEGVLAALRRLVDASMCAVEKRGDASRYRLLETIQDYATAQLADAGESVALRDRHLDHFLDVAEDAATALQHDDQDVVLAALEAEHDNLRAALEWGLSRVDPERGCHVAAALTQLWFLHGHSHEGMRFLQRSIDLTGDDGDPRLQADLLSGLALVAVPSGRLDVVEDAARRAVEIGTAIADDRILARAYTASAYIPFHVDFTRAQEVAQAARRHGAAAGETFATGWATVMEAFSLINRHRHDEAIALARPLYEQAMSRHDRFAAALARGVELWAALYTGDIRRAVVLGTEEVEIARPLNDYFTTGICLIHLAFAHGMAGEVEQGRRLIHGVLRTVEDAGPDVDVIGMSWIAGDLHLWGGELEDAVKWYMRTIRQYEAMPDNWVVARVLPPLANARRRLGRRDEAAAHAERAAVIAKRLPAPFMLAAALEQSGHVAASEDPGRAEDLHHEALRVRVEHELRPWTADSLDALAGLAVAQERYAEGLRLLAASDAARERMGFPRLIIDQPDHDAAVAAARAAFADGFDDAWAEGSALSLADAVAYASRSRGPRQRPSVGWRSLTPTEQQVVALVADGLTNPEIAERLFVSRATVKTHLHHVYTKLGITNRAELASLATKQQATVD